MVIPNLHFMRSFFYMFHYELQVILNNFWLFPVLQVSRNMVSSGMGQITTWADNSFLHLKNDLLSQLIDNSFLQYNSKDSSIKLVYEAQPRPKAIAVFSEKTIVKVACGTNHTGLFSPLFYVWSFLLNMISRINVFVLFHVLSGR